MRSQLFYRIFSVALILLSVSAIPAYSSTEHLAAYIKVWGYLKYFHPDVTAGKVNWDSEFVAAYSLTLSDNTFSIAIDNFFKSCGWAKILWEARLSSERAYTACGYYLDE